MIRRSFSLLVLAGSAGLAAWVFSTKAHSQLDLGKSSVALQASTPGYSQSGNANVAGIIRAGQFIGGKSSLTSSGVDPTLTLENLTSGFGSALLARATNGNTRAATFEGGTVGTYTSTTALGAIGAYIESTGNSAIGAQVVASGTSGLTTGLRAVAAGSSGTAVKAEGGQYGVYATGPTAIYAGGPNSTVGVQATAQGGFGVALSGSGVLVGVLGESTSGGYGGWLKSMQPSGIGLRVEGQSSGIEVNSNGSGVVSVLAQSSTGAAFAGSAGPNGKALWLSGKSILDGDVQIGQDLGPGRLNVFNPSATDGLANFFSPTLGPNYSHIHYGAMGDWYIRSAANNGKVVAQDNPGQFVVGPAGPIDPSWKMFVQGATYVNGFFAAPSKSFLIDHPLDPENKTLRHACVESDVHLNLYRGTVETDAKGYATVTMPEWFDALNEDIQVQLTVNDDADSEDFVIAKVVGRYTSGKFRIRSSAPHAMVSWLATGVRKDAFAKANPVQIEEWKSKEMRGRYLNPEAFGLPAERSDYLPPKSSRPQSN